MNIAINLLLTYFATMTPAGDGIRDLCDVVHRATGTPVICSPHVEGAPSYDADVCCAGTDCFAMAGPSCRAGETRYHCDLGEANGNGGVDCYFEVPDYCEVHECNPKPPGYNQQPEAAFICCSWGICTELYDGYCEEQDIYWCSSLATFEDGTLDCVDWD
ncbi:hypothetical protein [Enhygromyxa salina]|uniref:Uncharacterized protein n=1 Tax=Enhygromyxa salina TaxID=215803 RepID=A0A2S9YSK6_9BACT|nr:hypothetical protein [Enhygromyxa salina]PRQ08084.1 hypothetical protein ENSA7_22380 [Enhygromyxa salina]